MASNLIKKFQRMTGERLTFAMTIKLPVLGSLAMRRSLLAVGATAPNTTDRR